MQKTITPNILAKKNLFKAIGYLLMITLLPRHENECFAPDLR